jgi:F0F1-type ATP synthase gamma subunit
VNHFISVTGATIMTSQINPLRLRQFWNIVESSQASTLVRLDDESLVEALLRQFRSYQILDAHESQLVSEYIQSKLPLIRDLASQRMPSFGY